MKQFTFSAQVANNLLTLLQGYSKTIRLLLVMFLTLTVTTNAWGADVVYKTAKFGSSYNSAKVSSYTSSWYSTYDGFRVDIVNANNNNNGWSYIKMGSKDAASTGTITTNAKIDAAITKVSLKIDAITVSNITSITLKTATSSNGTYTSVGTFTKATGTQSVTIASPTANLFYKIEVVCTKGSSNGLIQISQVDYYKSDVVATPEYNITYVGDEHITYTGTKPETITKEDGGFELEFSVNDGYQLDDVQVKMGGQNLVVEDDYYWEEGYLLILPETDITGDIVITFVTVSTCTTNPTVSAGSHSNVTTTTATVSCSGGITSLGSAGCSIESYGFVYGTSTNPTISNTKVQVGTTYTTTSTAFSKGLTGLTANTTYYVRPYATNGNGTAYGTQTSFKTLELPKYTVTLNAGPGTCAASVTETSAGAGVTLPTPTLDCGNWEFAGWATSAVATETSSKPATLLTGTYKPTANTTLYAVYQRTETTQGGGGTENVSRSYTFSNYTAGTQYADDEVHKLDNDVTLTTTDCHFTSELRIYSSSTYNGYVVSNQLPGRIISIGFNAGNKVDKIAVYGSTNGTAWTEVGQVSVTSTSYANYSLSFGETNYTYFKLDVMGSNQVRLKSITITWESTSAGGTITTTYYHSTPDCGSTPDPIGYTITYNTNGGDVIAATSGTTLPNPLPTPTREHYTFVGWYTDESCTQAATAGATIDADITLYAKWEAILYTVTLNPNYPTGKTGTFIDKEENTVNGNLEVLLPSGTASQALTNFYSSIELDNYAFDGFYTQAEGGSKRVNTGDITGNITFYAHWKEKYTITWSVNGNTSLIEPTTFAAGDNTWEMPTTDYDCSGKGFVGWTTNPIIAAQDEAPDPLYTNASQFPNATATYHAVFAEGGSGGSGGYEKLTEALDDYSGEYLIVYEEGPVAFNGGLTTLDATSNNISVTITDGVIASNATTDAAKFTFAKVDGGYSILSASGRYIGRTADSNGLDESTSIAYTNTITITEGNADVVGSGNAHLRYNKDAGQTRFRYYKSSSYTSQQALALYKKSGSSATYTAYTTSCVASYSITYDFAGGTASHCSNTSVPQGDTYTICDEAPTREGHTFQGWSDGTSTYNAGATITPTGDVTLTAVWKANTYTVTWNSNGATTSKTYNHGDELVVPTAPASCDGVKEFVGWTTHSGYYHATTAPDDIFTTKTTPVTATATYYAVFATPGAGGTEFVLGESGTFKMYANVDGTNHYAQGGVSDGKLGSTTNVLSASDYTLTHQGDNKYTIQLGSSNIGHTASSSTNLSTGETSWTITEGVNGSWRIVSPVNASRALVYRTSTYNIFKAYSTASLEAGNTEYFDIEFGSGSDAHSDYTTICQTVESIEIANYTTEFFVTDEFAFGGTVTAHFDGGGTQDVTALAHFSGYNMNVTGTYTITVTYMGATATYEINVKPLDNAWVLTWNVSGKTNTGLGPRSVTKDSAIGTLPIPEVPAACAGKTFMGWTESNVVNSDGSGITYITKETVPTANTTYYAVFATVNNFSVQKPINDITDGSKVVIVAVASLDAGGTTGKAISSRTAADGNNLASDDVFVLDEQINTPHSTCVWTLTRESGKYIFTQDGKYLNAIEDPDKATSGFCKFNSTKDTWTISESSTNTYHMLSSNQNKYVEWFTATGVFKVFNVANTFGTFDMQFFVTANANGEADITDYTTGCAEYTITYYGFQGGYSTSCSSDGTIVLPVNSLHTIPNCGDVVKDHTNLNRTFTGVWMTQPHGGHTFKPGDTFILTQDTTLYAQWKLNTQNDFTTLPTDVEDLAGTDIYVYGGKTLTLQPGTTTINSLTLKGGIQTDGSYQMPSVWVPEGATLVRNSNKIYLDLVVNAENWYPFAVPFETKNTSDIHYLHPDMKSAAKYSKHFDIKTYDGARRADVGEDKANNWVRLKRHTAEEPVSFKPGVGYIISAMAYPGTDTATIRIPMTVPNTWFKNGEQAVVGTTVRNTIDVTAHTGEAATEHQRHAGWNFVANPYLSNFTGGGIDASNGLDYIDGALIIQGSYEYSEETVPYVTIPAYNFAYYSQHKLSEVKLSPEWSFFVQVGTSGTMDFTTTGRQQAPASIAARAEERPVKMDVDITLSDNHSSDQTGIIISDRYNDTYEIGRDLEKLFGSAYNLSVYTLMADNTPLAFQALAIRSNMQVIPVGYRAPEQGEYTFRLNEATSSIDLLNEQYEQLVLVDYQTGELTNLLIADYTFYSERTQADNRFAIYAVPRQNAPTDLPNAIGQDKQAQKIIHNGHLYILRDGNVYNGNGQIVK